MGSLLILFKVDGCLCALNNLNPCPLTGQVDVIYVWRDNGAGPAIDPFGNAGRKVDTAVAARMSIIIVPVGSMKCVAGTCEERYPRNSG